MSHGILVINLGTPNSAEVSSVRSYLREFLTDKRVIDLPLPLRWLLVNVLILPFRPKKSAHAYQSIWTTAGSPLLCLSQNLIQQLQQQVGSTSKVALGMRYGQPSIPEALNQLKECDSLTILPLYPQYSSAATGSSIEEVMDYISSLEVIPSLKIIRDFYKHPAYIKAQAEIIKQHLADQDHVLFSYHGIPERQILKSGCQKVCVDICPIDPENKGCYKAQCHNTSFLLAQELGLPSDQYSSAFQSRLGKTPWIKPYTDEVFSELAAQGKRKLVIACPSFVTDCLETLEEIGIRARQQWFELGGEEFTLVPCMNDSPLWVKAVVEITN